MAELSENWAHAASSSATGIPPPRRHGRRQASNQTQHPWLAMPIPLHVAGEHVFVLGRPLCRHVEAGPVLFDVVFPPHRDSHNFHPFNERISLRAIALRLGRRGQHWSPDGFRVSWRVDTRILVFVRSRR
jgi:hypothetical protein